jgi:O-antigen/teichoic acid export membrane protein
MKKKIEKENIIWNIIGSSLASISSLVFLIVLTRINGLDEAGIFTYAFATVCIFYSIAVYLGRAYQITDNKRKFSDSDYLANRFFTSIIMIITILLFCIINGYNQYKLSIFMLLAVYKSLEAISESIYAVIQRDNKLYVVGISLTIKSIGSYILFFIVDKLTNNVLLSIISITLLYLIIMILFDYRIAQKSNYIKSKVTIKNNNKLLSEGFYTFAFSFLSLYILNSSRYAIDLLLTNDAQSIFGIIVMPAMVMSLLSNFIIHPVLVPIKEDIKKKDYDSLAIKVNDILLKMIICGILCVFMAFLIGIPILNILYNINLNQYKSSFMIIMVASIFYGLCVIFSYVLIALRKTKQQFLGLLLTSILAFITSYFLIKRYDILGSSINLLFIMIIELSLYIYIYNLYLKKGKESENKSNNGLL